MSQQKPMNAVLETLRVVFCDVPMKADLRDAFDSLLQLIDSMADSPELLALDPAESRAFHGFRIGLHRFDSMEPDMMAKHALAQWRSVKTAVQKLSIWKDAEKAIKAIDRNHEKAPEL